MIERRRRSALFVPGSNVRALEKARTLSCDVIIIDLEDAVAPEAKTFARQRACEAVTSKNYGSHEVVVRINGFHTPWGRDDALAVAAAAPDAFLLPKVELPSHLADLQMVLDSTGTPSTVGIWAMIETPRAIFNALQIAEASLNVAPRLAALVAGTNDLNKVTRMKPGPDRAILIPYLTTLVAAARACNLAILDSVCNGFADDERVSMESRQARVLGMDGKTLIHPAQIAPCHQAFAPMDSEVAWARKVWAAFEEPANAGRGAVQVDGEMIERLHLEEARRILDAKV